MCYNLSGIKVGANCQLIMLRLDLFSESAKLYVLKVILVSHLLSLHLSL